MYLVPHPYLILTVPWYFIKSAIISSVSSLQCWITAKSSRERAGTRVQLLKGCKITIVHLLCTKHYEFRFFVSLKNFGDCFVHRFLLFASYKRHQGAQRKWSRSKGSGFQSGQVELYHHLIFSEDHYCDINDIITSLSLYHQHHHHFHDPSRYFTLSLGAWGNIIAFTSCSGACLCCDIQE